MVKNSRFGAATLLAVIFAAPVLHADPLHAIAGDAYWHHESHFIFPAALAGFTRIGAPQEVDGSTTINAHYGGGENERWMALSIDLFPGDAGPADFPGAIAVETIDLGHTPGSARRALFKRNIDEVIYYVEHGNWRLIVRARLLEDSDAARIEQFVRALPLERLGSTDTRCPNAGCGS